MQPGGPGGVAGGTGPPHASPRYLPTRFRCICLLVRLYRGPFACRCSRLPVAQGCSDAARCAETCWLLGRCSRVRSHAARSVRRRRGAEAARHFARCFGCSAAATARCDGRVRHGAARAEHAPRLALPAGDVPTVSLARAVLESVVAQHSQQAAALAAARSLLAAGPAHAPVAAGVTRAAAPLAVASAVRAARAPGPHQAVRPLHASSVKRKRKRAMNRHKQRKLRRRERNRNKD